MAAAAEELLKHPGSSSSSSGGRTQVTLKMVERTRSREVELGAGKCGFQGKTQFLGWVGEMGSGQGGSHLSPSAWPPLPPG